MNAVDVCPKEKPLLQLSGKIKTMLVRRTVFKMAKRYRVVKRDLFTSFGGAGVATLAS